MVSVALNKASKRKHRTCYLLTFLCGLTVLSFLSIFRHEKASDPSLLDLLPVSCPKSNDSAPEAILPKEETVTRPYGDFCETTVLNERQTWNPRKKVLSFSLFSAKDGTLPDWLFQGLKYNVESAKLYYPDWISRIYTMGIPDEMIQNILNLSSNVEVVKCHESSPLTTGKQAHKMITRFLTVDDPTVYYTNVRDVDSRYSPRELMAVNEWMSSDMLFHTMRDNPLHGVAVMGGMFGMKRGCLGNMTMTELVKQYFNGRPGGDDQTFLKAIVWPLVKSTAMDHDMNPKRCEGQGSAICREWPLGPNNIQKHFFVGAPFQATHWTSNVKGYKCKLDCETEWEPGTSYQG